MDAIRITNFSWSACIRNLLHRIVSTRSSRSIRSRQGGCSRGTIDAVRYAYNFVQCARKKIHDEVRVSSRRLTKRARPCVRRISIDIREQLLVFPLPVNPLRFTLERDRKSAVTLFSFLVACRHGCRGSSLILLHVSLFRFRCRPSVTIRSIISFSVALDAGRYKLIFQGNSYARTRDVIGIIVFYP